MAYDEQIASEVRRALSRLVRQPDEEIDTVRMFGGLCFTLNKKMLVGVAGTRLVIRLSDDDFDEAYSEGKATPMDFTGRPMRNFAYIASHAFATDEELLGWISRSAAYVRTNVLLSSAKSKRGKS